MAESCDMIAKKGPQHESLARFAGTWRAEVKLFFTPGQGPQVSHGTMVNTLELGGLFLRQHYRDDAGLFEGHGYWGYNTTEGRYEGFWIDPMCSFFQLEHGQHDVKADAYHMAGSMTCPHTRQPLRKRAVITHKSPTEHTMEQWVETTPNQERKTMEIRYTRA